VVLLLHPGERLVSLARIQVFSILSILIDVLPFAAVSIAENWLSWEGGLEFGPGTHLWISKK